MKLQLIFISSLNSEKASGCQMKEKKIMFESISMAGSFRRLFKPFTKHLWLKAK